jgi:hypothetical protein
MKLLEALHGVGHPAIPDIAGGTCRRNGCHLSQSSGELGGGRECKLWRSWASSLYAFSPHAKAQGPAHAFDCFLSMRYSFLVRAIRSYRFWLRLSILTFIDAHYNIMQLCVCVCVRVCVCVCVCVWEGGDLLPPLWLCGGGPLLKTRIPPLATLPEWQSRF